MKTNNNIRKRSIALLLTLCMSLTLIPLAAGSEAVNAGVDLDALLAEGSYVYMGTYNHATALAEGVYGAATKEAEAAPILWRVMGEENGDGKIGLLSEYVLDSLPFAAASTQGSNVFGTSALRAWLGGAFINESFTPGEAALVPSSEIVTRMLDLTANERVGSQQGTLYPVQSLDRAYLPSGNIRDDSIAWTADINPDASPVDPGKGQLRSQAGTDNYVHYWLRSPYYGGNATLFVSERGESLGAASPGIEKGVRPVSKLDPGNIVFASEILSNTAGRPDATQANAFYAQPAEGKAYKLTVLGDNGSGSNPYQLTNLTYNGGAVPEFIQGEPGTPVTLQAVGNDTADTTINYKLVDRRNNLLGYGIGSASVNSDGATVITLNIPAGLPDAYYTAHIWLQKNRATSSHEASTPLAVSIRIGEGEIVPRAMILNPPGEMLTPGQTLQLAAQFIPSNTTDQAILSWTSSDPAVATVDQNGLVTALDMGSAFITAVSRSDETIIGTSEIVVTDGSPGEMRQHILYDYEDYTSDGDMPWSLQPGNETGNTGASLGQTLMNNGFSGNSTRLARFNGGGTGNRGTRMNLRNPIESDYRINYSFDWYPMGSMANQNYVVLGFQDQTSWTSTNYINFILNGTGVHYRLGAMTHSMSLNNLNLITATRNAWYRFSVDFNFAARTINLLVTNRTTGAVVFSQDNIAFASGTSTSNRITGMMLLALRSSGTLEYTTYFDNWDIRVYTAMSRPTLGPVTNENPRTGTFDISIEPYTINGASFNIYVKDLDGNETLARTADAPGNYTITVPRGNGIYTVTAEATVNGAVTNRSFPRMAVLFEEGLEPPGTVTAAEIDPGNGQYVLDWTKVTDADSYVIYRSFFETGPYVKIADVGDVSTYTDIHPSLSAISRTYYRFQAVGNGGASEMSQIFYPTSIGPTIPPEAGTDRAVTAVNLAGEKGAQTLVSAMDSAGNEYTEGVYLSWRWYEADAIHGTTFDVYRNGTRIAANLGVTNLVDVGGTRYDVYRVVGSSDEAQDILVRDTRVWGGFYLELQLYRPESQRMPDGFIATYATNDMTVADLDGDGTLDLIVKWYPSNAQDSANGPTLTGTTIFDAYKVNWGTGEVKLLWRIDLGVNVRSGAHYAQFGAWDFKGDGNGAQFMVQTADGTSTYRSLDGTDQTLIETGFVGAVSRSHHNTAVLGGRPNHDYRGLSNGWFSTGRPGNILDGPEYVTAFNGATGEIIGTVPQAFPRNTDNNGTFGDNTGNRVSRYNSTVAYLDGPQGNAYYVLNRGYYERTTLAAYYIDDTGALRVGPTFDSRTYTPFGQQGNPAQSMIEGNGNHGIMTADITGTGKDYIIMGGLILTNELKPYVQGSTTLGHGDAHHMSNFITDEHLFELLTEMGTAPDSIEDLRLPNGKPRQYIMQPQENTGAALGVQVRDALTGQFLFGYFTGNDTGRGVAGDIDPTSRGAEFWASSGPSQSSSEWYTRGGVYAMETYGLLRRTQNGGDVGNLTKLSDNSPSQNFTIFWSGDLLSEMQCHTFVDNASGYYPVSVNITKWDYLSGQEIKLFESDEVFSTNGTKGNVGLVADILGDWREEMIVRDSRDNSKVRVYMSTIQTDYVVPHLMEDHQYALAVTWQQSSYNQPANPSFMASSGVITARNLDYRTVSATGGVVMSYTPANDGLTASPQRSFGFELTGHQLWRKDGNAGTISLAPAGTLSATTALRLAAAGYTMVGQTVGNGEILDATGLVGETYSYIVIGVADGKLSYIGKPVTFTIEARATVSSDATLAELGLSYEGAAIDISPDFNPDVTAYTAVVPFYVDAVEVTAEANDPAAAVEGAGPAILAIGENEIIVEVTAESGDSMVYTITVTREAPVIVTFLDDDDEATVLKVDYISRGGTAAPPVLESRAGYVFLGWFTDGAPGEAFDFETPIFEDTVLTAKWSRILITSLRIAVAGEDGVPAPAAPMMPVVRNTAYSFTVIADPAEALTDNVTWSVSNTNLATVDAITGQVTTRGTAGNVTLTARDMITGISHSIVLRIP